MKPEPEDGPGPFSAVQHIFSLPLRHTKPAVRHVSWQHIDTHSWQLLVIRLLTASWHAQLGAVSYPSVDSILTDTVDSCQLSVCWYHLDKHSWQVSIPACWYHLDKQLKAVNAPSTDIILTSTVDICQYPVCWHNLDKQLRAVKAPSTDIILTNKFDICQYPVSHIALLHQQHQPLYHLLYLKTRALHVWISCRKTILPTKPPVNHATVTFCWESAVFPVTLLLWRCDRRTDCSCGLISSVDRLTGTVTVRQTLDTFCSN